MALARSARLGQGAPGCCLQGVLLAGAVDVMGVMEQRGKPPWSRVQGGEGSGKLLVPLLVKDMTFVGREALPGESPAGLGWGNEAGSYQDNPRAGVMDWATNLGYKIWV